MNLSYLSGGVKAMALLCGILTLFLLNSLRRDEGSVKRMLHTYRELSGLVKTKGLNSNLYRRMDGWLKRNGASFHYGEWVDPVRFVTLSLLLGLAGLGTLATVSLLYGGTAFLVLGSLPAILLLYFNKQDNERQLSELKLVYHALEIQIKAGVYVTDALAECYGSVREKRLRQALLDLAGDIVMKADVYESLDRFQSKFENKYVDSLCIIILQALESGQAVELLRDISEQIKDMEESVLARKKGALDRKLTFCQLGVLTVVLGLALYACVTYMFGAAVMF